MTDDRPPEFWTARRTPRSSRAFHPLCSLARNSLKTKVPGPGVEPTRPRGSRDFKPAGKGRRIKDLANSLPFSRPRSTRRVVESEYGHRDGHLVCLSATADLLRESSSPARDSPLRAGWVGVEPRWARMGTNGGTGMKSRSPTERPSGDVFALYVPWSTVSPYTL